jgi:capsular polysaccharide export protein
VVSNSSYKGIPAFIEEVIKSFAKVKEKYAMLVFKHHPMDRGYNQYGRFISECAKFYGIKDRVLYIHEVNNVKLIKNSCGAVAINSTMGFQILHYNIPIKVMGKAIYDYKGLTHQGCLDSFWENPQPVSRELFNRLKDYLIQTCQIPGSFYGRDINELGAEENNVVIYK